MFASPPPPPPPPPPPSPKPEAITSIPSPRQESSGERASIAGPAGRSKANSFRQSSAQNRLSVRKNGRLSPPALPPKSKIPAPPPPNDPPPSAPPPRAPHERKDDVRKYVQAASSWKESGSIIPGGRPATLPKKPPRPSSELAVERPQDPPLRQLRAIPIRAVATSCASRGTSPLRQMNNVRQLQIPSQPRPLSGLSQETFLPMEAHEIVAPKSPTKSSRASVMSLKRPPLTEESINAAAARTIRDRRDSSSTISSMAMSAVSLPYPLIRHPHTPLPPHRAVSLSSLRRSRATFLGSSRSSNVRRHEEKQSSLNYRSSGSKSLFTRRMNSASSGRSALVRPVLFVIDDLKRMPKRQSGVAKSMKPTSPTAMKPTGRRKKKDETMSMLLDDGFFPVEELVYGKSPSTTKVKKRYSSMAGFRINLPPRLSFIEMNSPLSSASPTMPGTPEKTRNGKETPTTPRSTRSRGYGGSVARNLLSQMSESEDIGGDNKAATAETDHSSSNKSKSNSDERSASPGTVTPVVTQIQLRNGSIVTLTPPELTAWQPTLFLHGPIKLPKATSMPRKNSVATLDPFQDAIERLYQNTLTIPRRRSDDAVVDEICDFFDAFGFDLISFTADDFSEVDFGVGALCDIALDTETFSTPPMEPTIDTPAEAAIAHEMLERIDSSQSFVFEAPPVENEATLRARGIARLSRTSASSTGTRLEEDSITLQKPPTSAVLPLLVAPETSPLDAVHHPGQRDRNYTASVYSQRHPEGSSAFVHRKVRDNASLRTTRTSSSGVRVPHMDEGVEEMEGAESARTGKAKPVVIAPASKETKLSRMRRLVASASSIL